MKALDEAIAWRLRLEAGDADVQSHDAFGQWLAIGEHARIWQQFGALDARFAAIDPPARSALLKPRHKPRALVRGVLASLLLCVAALPLVNRQWPLAELGADEITATGEIRTLQLPDDSQLVMNTRTALDLDFGGVERRVLLRRGEILIETAHGDARPFVVETPAGRLRALGTRFLVSADAAGTRLTVLASAVVATPREGTHLRVDAGKALLLREGEAPVPAPLGADAWTHGMLAADNMRLAELIAVLARYQTGVLAVDPCVADLRVTGSFPLRDLDLALTALSQTRPLLAQRRAGGWWITIRPRE